MSFLYPAALWGLGLLLIPIIVHLFNFRRLQVVEFSTLQFITEIESEVKRKKSLKHILVLLSRLLVLFFLVMAFAQPVLNNNDGPVTNPGRTVIYLDNSLSMSGNSVQGNEMLTDAINISRTFLSNYPLEKEVILKTNDFGNNLYRWNYKNSVIEQLTELDYSTHARSFNNIKSSLDQMPGNYNVLFISDFQKSTFGQIPGLDARYYFVPIESSDAGNVYVDSVYFEDPIILFDKLNTLKIRLGYTGQSSTSDINLKILNEARLVSSSPVRMQDSQRKEVEFEMDLRNLTSNRLRIEFDDQGLQFDNNYYFIVNSFTRPVIRTVFTTSPNSFLRGVYGNKELFDFRQIDFAQINYQELEDADLVILEDFDEIPQGLFRIANSSDILIIPTEEFSEDSYTRFFGSTVTRTSDSAQYNIEIPEIENPIFGSVFESTTDTRDMPKGRLVVKTGLGTQVLSTAFGENFLSHKMVSNHNIYLYSAPFKVEYTNLPIHAIFLPVMYRIAQFSSQTPLPLAYDLGARVLTFPGHEVDPQSPILIRGEETEFVPNYNMAAGNITLELPPSDLDPGYYHVLNSGDTIQSFALNFNKMESRDLSYTLDELEAIIEGRTDIEIVEVNELDLSSNISGASLGDTSLWKYALILSILFLITETLLLRFL